MKLIQKIKVNLQNVLTQIHTWYKAETNSLPDSINDNIYTNGKVGIGFNNPETNLHIMDSDLAELVIQTVKDNSEAKLLFKCEDNTAGARQMARGGIIFKSGNNIWGNGDLHLCNYSYDYWGLYLDTTHAVLTLHGNKETTFLGYPNTRNDTETPVNILFTSTTGKLQSKQLKDVFTQGLPKTYVEEDNIGRVYSTEWTVGPTWQTRTIRDGYEVKIHFEIPASNDSNSWGGGYVDVEYSINGSAFVSIGNSGHQLAMGLNAQIKNTYVRTVYLKRSEISAPPSGDFNLQVRFKFRSHDGNLYINADRGTNSSRFATLFELSEINFDKFILYDN